MTYIQAHALVGHVVEAGVGQNARDWEVNNGGVHLSLIRADTGEVVDTVTRCRQVAQGSLTTLRPPFVHDYGQMARCQIGELP